MLRFALAALCAAAMPAFACNLAADAPPGQYDGDCLNGLAHGRGVARSPLYTYEGDFFEGRRHGRGVLAISDGTRYEGEFRHGKRHGQGIATMAGGLRYEGAWVEGEIRGYGRTSHPNGDVYEGQFLNFERSGRGVLVTADGRRIQGEWREGRFVGPAAPSPQEVARACHQRAESCETACAVGALGGALLSRGKTDGQKENAECAARCEAAKQACLGNTVASVPSPGTAPASTGAPAAYVGPDMTKCFVVRHSGNQAEIIDRCEGRNRNVGKRIAYCLTGPLDARVRHKECGGPAFAKWIDWAPSGESHSLGLPTFDFNSTLVLAYGARVELFGCHSPYWPTDVRWDGRRLTATCAKCGKFAADGKATCLKYED